MSQFVRDFCSALSKLSELWRALNFPIWAGHLSIRTGSPILNLQNLLHATGMLIFFIESFLGILLLDPRFFFHHIVLFHKFVQVFDTLKIPVLCFGFALKTVICLSISQLLFHCYAIFTRIWTYKTHGLTDHQLILGSFLPAWEGLNNPEVTPILRAALISPCALLGRFHPPDPFAKPPPRFSVCDSGHAHSSGSVVF